MSEELYRQRVMKGERPVEDGLMSEDHVKVSEELLPCPFCGDDGDLIYDKKKDAWYICCINLKTDTDTDCILSALDYLISFYSKEEATKAWNTRA